MTEHVTGTTAEMIAYKATVDKSIGAPYCRYRHVGGGRHIDVDEKTPGGPGWTTGFAEVRKHPKTEDLCCHVKVDLPEHAAVSVAEAQAVKDKNDKAAKLDPSWDDEQGENEP
jgi:hypothetical protein